jgi:hypothetical protein
MWEVIHMVKKDLLGGAAMTAWIRERRSKISADRHSDLAWEARAKRMPPALKGGPFRVWKKVSQGKFRLDFEK